MSSTLALLGFLALTFLLLCRASMACQRRNSHVHKQPRPQHQFTGHKIEPKKPAVPPEQSDTMVPVRQA